MPTGAGQAITAETKALDSFIKDAVQAPDGLVIDPPLQRTVAGVLFEAAEDVFFRRVQNNGTAAIAFIVTGDQEYDAQGVKKPDPVPSALSKHGVISASAVEDDGTGGIESFRITKGKVVFAALGGGSIKLDIMQYRNPGIRIP